MSSRDFDPTLDPTPSGPDAATLDPRSVAGVLPLREGPGTTIGPFKILQLIGEGGFGSVFMAEQEKPVQRRVALKIIKLGMDTRQVVARFEQERQALAMMDHPNIARVLDAGATETGRPYFVMDLVKGDPIVEYCDRNNLSIHERLDLFSQVCSAVQHAHTKGIIHRDIKPSNILVSTQDGRPSAKVIDFGIAKATSAKLTEKTLFTEHRQLIGTPEYMSPEQAEGSLDIDTRTDIYSLGVLLYELLTGTTPFDSESLRSAAYAEIQRIIREIEPPRPSTRLSRNTETLASVAAQRHTEPRRLGAIVRGELDWIVMKALEKDRSRRYETANGLAMDIRRYLSGEAIFAAPPSAGYRIRKFVRRNRVVMAAAGAVAIALTIGLIAFAWQAGVARAERAEAVKQRDLAQAAEARAVSEAAKATTAEAKAVAEALTSRTIADFTGSIFKGVAPRVALGRDTALLRELVDSASDRIEKELTDQPAVATSLLELLARVYNELAAFDKASELARRSVELAKGLPGDNHLLLGRALVSLGSCLESMGKYPEAKATFQEAYDLFQSAGEGDTEEGLGALNAIGAVLYRTNDTKAAEPIFRKVLNARKALYQGKDDSGLATSTERLAIVLSDLGGGPSEVESLAREALAMRRRLHGDVHPDVAVSLSNLAACLVAQKRFDEALELGQQAIDMHRKLFGDRHPRTASAIMSQGANLDVAGRVPEAIQMFRLALDINRESLGPDHRTTLNCVNSLAMTLTRVGDFAGAEEQYRVMLAWGRANYAAGDNRTSSVIMLVARSLTGQGRHADAEPLYREALEARIAHRPAGHPQITDSRNALADCLVALDRSADAEPLLLAVEQDARTAGAPPSSLAAATKRLAEFYARWASTQPGAGHEANAAEWKGKLEGISTDQVESASPR